MTGAPSPGPRGAGFWIALAVGGAAMLYGGYGLLHLDAAATRPSEWVRWWFGADVAHDLVLAPIVCVAGFALARFVTASVRAPIRAGLVGSGLMLAVGWAPLRGYGRATVPDNPTVQPLDYTTAVVTALVIVWAIVALWIASAALARSRSPRAH